MNAATRIIALAALLVVAGQAAAESLRDPTRPAFDIGGGTGDGSGRVGDPAPGAVAAARAAPRGPRLQSILSRADGSSLAVIDGRTLAVGDRFGSRRLVDIGVDRVTLAGSSGRLVLRLTPEAQKTAVKAGRKSAAREEGTQAGARAAMPPGTAQPGRKER